MNKCKLGTQPIRFLSNDDFELLHPQGYYKAMSAVAKRSIFLLGMLLLIFQATLLACSGTAKGAGFVVDSPADVADANPGDRVCDDGAGNCTLRAALQEANGLAGTDTITLPANTYTLTLGTELTIGTDLTLNGAGSGDTIIQAATSSADATSRVFHITGGTVAISGVTVRNGSQSAGGGIRNFGILTLANSTVSGNGGGGGIFNIGTLTLTNSTVSGNTSTSNNGGGIYNSGGTVTLINSTVSGNTNNFFGGGIWNNSTLTLTNSTVSGNTTNSNGGGVYNTGTLTLTNSTVSGNTATDFGGGIFNDPDGTLTVTNTTISGNSTDGDGGGIYNVGTLTLTNSTVSGNTATDGGGIYILGGTAELINAIFALNLAPTGPDCFGSPTSLGYNLIGEDTGCGYTAATGDLVGDGANPIDPLLGPLQDNGGPTFTHALLDGSPAIDHIPTELCIVDNDQRGIPRPQGSACDIGAYELVPFVEAIRFNARLSGDEVPSVVETDAKGIFRARLNEAGTELEYVLLVGKIRGLTAAHIHCAPLGEVGAMRGWCDRRYPVRRRSGGYRSGSPR